MEAFLSSVVFRVLLLFLFTQRELSNAKWHPRFQSNVCLYFFICLIRACYPLYKITNLLSILLWEIFAKHYFSNQCVINNRFLIFKYITSKTFSVCYHLNEQDYIFLSIYINQPHSLQIYLSQPFCINLSFYSYQPIYQ